MYFRKKTIRNAQLSRAITVWHTQHTANTAYSRDVCAVYIAGICAAFAEITEAGEYKGTFVHFCSTIF